MIESEQVETKTGKKMLLHSSTDRKKHENIKTHFLEITGDIYWFLVFVSTTLTPHLDPIVPIP